MSQQQSPSRRRKSTTKASVTLKTPQDFELRKPAVSANECSVHDTSSFMSIPQSSSTHLINQSDQFFIVPGMDGALSREEFSKLTPSGSPEKGRNSDACLTEMAAARQSLCDLAEVARRKEQEWRTLQELRIRGLEDAVQGREQSLQQERRRFQRTVDEMTQQQNNLENQLAQSGASREHVQQLTDQLDKAESTIRKLTQERDTMNTKLANVISKQEAVESAATKLREENEQFSHKYRTLEKEAQAARRSNDWLTKRLQHSEEEREKLAESGLQMKVTMGKIQGYLKEEENTLEVCRAELNNVKEAKETVELELAAEKTEVRDLKERLLKMDKEQAVSRNELEDKLADKTKKISFLVQGIKTLESDWKERYRELQESSSATVQEVERSHSVEQERLLAIVRAGEDKLRGVAQQGTATQTEVQRLRAENDRLLAEEAEARRARADERRESAQLLAARDLSLAELRAQLERQTLEVGALSGDRRARESLTDKLEETRRLLAQWQAACTKLRAYAERVTAERDRLAASAPDPPLSTTTAQIEKDNTRLRGLVRRMRDELDTERQQRRQHQEAAVPSPHCSSCSSGEDAKALQIRQLLITNAKLNDTIEAQCETVKEIHSELNRHRSAAHSSQFLRQETAYLRSLLEGGGDDAGNGGSVAAAESSGPAGMRELRYKLQLAARYIAHLGKERAELLQRQKQLEDRLAAAQRGTSLPDHLDKLRLSQRSWSPGPPRHLESVSTAASFAELLDQLNNMQVDSEAAATSTRGSVIRSARATCSSACPAGTQTGCRHVLNPSCRHGHVFESGDDILARVPRLVGVGDCRSPDGYGTTSGARSVSTDDLTSATTLGTGDALSTGEAVPAPSGKKRQQRSRSVPHKRQHSRKK